MHDVCRHRLFMSVFFLGTLAVLSGCRVFVTYPQFGSAIIGDSTDIRIKYENGATVQFAATLNEVDITGRFSHSAPDPDGWILAEASNVNVNLGEFNTLQVEVVIDGVQESGVSVFSAQTRPDPSGIADDTGRAGGYVDLTLDQFGLPHISCYDSVNTALRYTRFVPATGFAQMTLTGYGAGEVGRFSQIATRDDGSTLIAYFDDLDKSLKLVIYRNYWIETVTIDSGTAEAAVGQFPSMVYIASSDTAYISYYDEGAGALKLASGNEQRGFTTGFVDNDPDNDVGKWSSLAIATNGKIAIAYEDTTNHNLRYAEGYSLPLTIQVVSYQDWFGSDISLALLSNGDPAISCFNETDNDLMFACRRNNVWTVRTVASEGATGFFSSIVADNSNRVFISYANLSNRTINLAASADLQNFTSQVIYEGGSDGDPRASSMVLDHDGYLGIAFCDVGFGQLHYARVTRPQSR